MLILLIACGLVFLALIMRFIQPELLYSLRQVVIEVNVNRAFLDYEVGRAGANQRLKRMLRKLYRFETRSADENYALQRVVKIRELYRLLSLDKTEKTAKGLENHPQVCIVELADLIGNLAREMRRREEFEQPIVWATDVLMLIGNRARQEAGEPPLNGYKAVEQWFTDNPVSIEQIIEVLIAVVFGLAYRQREERLVAVRPKRGEFVDFWKACERLEKKLRLMVREGYLATYGTEERVKQKLEQFLGAQELEKILRRIERERRQEAAADVSALDMLEFAYIGELEVLCFRIWNAFKDAFPEKSWLKGRLGKIVSIRNAAAHHRTIANEEVSLGVGYCWEIENRIKGWFEKGLLSAAEPGDSRVTDGEA